MQYYCSLPLLSICNIIIIEFCFRIQLRSTTGKKSHICFFAALKPEFVLQKYSRMVLGYFEVTSLIITLMTSNDKLFDSIQRFPSPQHIKMHDLGVQFIRTQHASKFSICGYREKQTREPRGTREETRKRGAAPRGFAARSCVLARLPSLAKIGELARRLIRAHQW